MSAGSEAVARPLPRRGRLWVVLILAVAIFGLGYAIVEIATKPPGKTQIKVEGAAEAQEIFGGIAQEGDRLGPENAEVQIQVFTDLQCGSCREEFLGTIPGLTEKYVRPGDVELLLRHYSIAENATEIGFFGAEAAAQQGYGWQYTYLFFRNQSEVERLGRVTDDFLEAIAAPLGELDVPEWNEYLEQQRSSDGAAKKTLQGYDELGESLGIRTQEAMVITGPKGTRTLQEGPTLGQIEHAMESVRET